MRHRQKPRILLKRKQKAKEDLGVIVERKTHKCLNCTLGPLKKKKRQGLNIREAEQHEINGES